MIEGKSFIWFDIGYTLLYLEREQLFIKLAEERGMASCTHKDAMEAFHYTDKLFMREYRGVLGKEKDTYMPWYLGHLFHYLGIKTDICSFYKTWKQRIGSPHNAWHLCPGVLHTLDYLRGKGYRMGIISNWDRSAKSLLAHLHILDYFDTVVISSEAGCEKPSEEIFTLALQSAGVSADKSLYIGDNYYDDVPGCRAVGMDVLIINRYGNKGIEEIKGIDTIENVTQLETLL